MDQKFDIFLSHNSKDKPAVKELAEHLRRRGLKVWLDVEQLRPGRYFQDELERMIKTIGAAAILIGRDGLGAWEVPEMRACLQEFVGRNLPVIPVLLPGAPAQPELPVFLKQFTWVDLRGGFSEEGIARIVWGVTGSMALETTREIVVELARRKEQQEAKSPYVDSWGIASVKSRLHALSEVVALAASEEAALAAATYKGDTLSIVVPMTFEMRWRRGYAAALEQMFMLRKTEKFVRDFACAEVPGGCPLSEGVLSATEEADSRVTIHLDARPAVSISGLKPDESAALCDSVNLHGRLGVPDRGGMTLLERVGEIPVRDSGPAQDQLTTTLFQNREALAPLIAALGMPGSEWLLPEEEELYLPTGDDNVASTDATVEDEARGRIVDMMKGREGEIFEATKAVHVVSFAGHTEQDGWAELLESDAVRQLFGDLVDKDPQQVVAIIKSLNQRNT